MNDDNKHTSPVPGGSFNSLNGIEKEGDLIVPDGFFDSLENVVVGRIGEDEGDAFFHLQEEKIMATISRQDGKENAEFLVPKDYFLFAEESVMQSVSSVNKMRRRVATGQQIWWYAAGLSAAALVVLGVFFFRLSSPSGDSFASLLEDTSVTFDDMQFFASDEEYYELYIHEIDSVFIDVFLGGGPAILMPPDTTDSAALPLAADTVFSSPVKPLNRETSLKWEELTEEEMIEYLMNEEANDPYNEVN